MAELQRDPVTRGQFLTMGIVGSAVGAVLTIPPFVYMINPVIETNFLGQSDIPDGWIEAGSVFDIPSGAPKEYLVEFPQNQTYDGKDPKLGERSLINAVLVSWRDGKLPGLLQSRGTQRLSASEIEELTRRINVMSNACAHLGCPVRWAPDKGLIVCPCHGGEYDINGGYRAGPPPHGLFHFAFEIRDSGGLYVKHEFFVKNNSTGEFVRSTPWVV